MSHSTPPAVQPDWLSKSVAGLVLGFTLAMGCSGLAAWLLSDLAMGIRTQLVMWMVAPIWLGVLSSVYFFQSGKRAWAWLAGANLVVLGLLALSRAG